MKIRAHRALLEDAMKTVQEIEPTKEAVYNFVLMHVAAEDHLNRMRFLSHYKHADIEVKPYHYDSRIGWDTHIVTLLGDAVAFTDGPIDL